MKKILRIFSLILCLTMTISLLSACGEKEEIEAKVEIETVPKDEYVDNSKAEELPNVATLDATFLTQQPKTNFTFTSSSDKFKGSSSKLLIDKVKIENNESNEILRNFEKFGGYYEAKFSNDYRLDDEITISLEHQQSKDSLMRINTTIIEMKFMSACTTEYVVNMANRMAKYNHVDGLFKYETVIYTGIGSESKTVQIEGTTFDVYKECPVEVYYKDGAYHIKSDEYMSNVKVRTMGYAENKSKKIVTNLVEKAKEFTIVINDDGTATITNPNAVEVPETTIPPTKPSIEETTEPIEETQENTETTLPPENQ